MKKNKYIAVFCSANDLDEKYTRPAKEFARKMNQHGYYLVWGGTDKGLMKIMADQVQNGGGRLVGITVEFLRKNARTKTDELIVAPTISERKSKMLHRCDAIVVLVGGIGTLDEVTEMFELRKHKIHDKPIVILNSENFYEGLKMQLQKMKDDGFISKALDELVYFADTPHDAINYINNNIK